MVWGGISLECRTNLHVLANSTLTAVCYRDEILRPIVRPYAGVLVPGFLLVQDNARPHVARVCRQFLDDGGIDTIDWPSRSLELNPRSGRRSPPPPRRRPSAISSGAFWFGFVFFCSQRITQSISMNIFNLNISFIEIRCVILVLPSFFLSSVLFWAWSYLVQLSQPDQKGMVCSFWELVARQQYIFFF